MRIWQLVPAVVLLACGGNDGGGARGPVHPTTIQVNADAAVTVDAVTEPTVGGATYVPVDASTVDLWRDPSTLFPDCTGTVDQVSDCIINLPSRTGVPVTSTDPMAYSACKP